MVPAARVRPPIRSDTHPFGHPSVRTPIRSRHPSVRAELLSVRAPIRSRHPSVRAELVEALRQAQGERKWERANGSGSGRTEVGQANGF